MRMPDYVYNDAVWEVTVSWQEKDLLLEAEEYLVPVKLGTLIKGPDMWAVKVDPFDVRWFDTEEEAKAYAAMKNAEEDDTVEDEDEG